ncbi:E3 ubiquitin-protein ligase ubr-1 [Thelohanellus kitauei]|uniref:E3 ubiquitin-protein ligase n=1 Tax=Thelohanellus kitauei TaxID=669202 RepID=A0A0C2I6L8_THEKT|nr:E3 ubiquitin-protein ligase ubr-1 [Thelohanellus kitauei]
MEEARLNVDAILARALWITSEKSFTSLLDTYSIKNLKKLVIEPLEKFIVKGFDLRFKQLFSSEAIGSPRCVKNIFVSEPMYICLDCANDYTRGLCQDCFFNSEHESHLYKRILSDRVTVCFCGNLDAYKKSPSCSKHTQMDEKDESIPQALIDRIHWTFCYLSQFLEKQLYDNKQLDKELDRIMVSQQIWSFLEKQGPDSPIFIAKLPRLEYINTRRCCVIVLGCTENIAYNVSLVDNLLNLTDEEKILIKLQVRLGNECIVARYSEDIKRCKRRLSFKKIFCPFCLKPGIRFKVIKIYRLFFMKLMVILIHFIGEICLRNYTLCEILSNIIFNETNLLDTYVLKEGNLHERFKSAIFDKILMAVSVSEAGKIQIAKFCFYRLDSLCAKPKIDFHHEMDSFFQLVARLASSPRFVITLVEEGFLTLILDYLTLILSSLGLKKGYTFTRVNKKGIPWDYIHELFWVVSEQLTQILNLDLMTIELSVLFRRKLRRAGLRLIMFCDDFDDLEPIQRAYGFPDSGIEYESFIRLIITIHKFLARYVNWLVFDSNIANLVLSAFLRMFKQSSLDLESLTPGATTGDRLMIQKNAQNEPFSIFNLSMRVFVDIFMHCSMNECLCDKISIKLLTDWKLLLWISRCAINSTAFECNYKSPLLPGNLSGLTCIAHLYHNTAYWHYLFMQDFNTIQILMSRMDPEKLMGYISLNMFPHTQNAAKISFSVSSIFNVITSGTLDLYTMLTLVYNSLTERHFVGVIQDREGYLLERQLIHFLFSKDRTYEEIKVLLCPYRRIQEYEVKKRDFLKRVDEILNLVSFKKSFLSSDSKYSLNPRYFSAVNVFYFAYSSLDSAQAYERLRVLYRNKKCRFELPEIVDLVDSFKGLNDFLFSYSFFDLLLKVLTNWGANGSHFQRHSPNVIALVLMCLSLILKLSKNTDMYSQYTQIIDFIHGKHPKLENRTILEFLVDKRTSTDEPVINAVIEYFIQLSNTQTIDVETNPENDAKKRARECRELLLKSLQARCNKFTEKNDEWLKYTENKEDQDSGTQETDDQHQVVLCDLCQISERNSQSTTFDIYHYPTSFICFARTRESLKLQNMKVLKEDGVLMTDLNPQSPINAISNDGQLQSMIPGMFISGCCHFSHIKCAPYLPKGLIFISNELLINLNYKCRVCHQKNNFFIPFAWPIKKELSRNTALSKIKIFKYYLTHLIKSKTWDELNQSNSSFACFHFRRTIKNALISPLDDNNVFLKNCATFNCVDTPEASNFSSRIFCSTIISKCISSLANTIAKLEILDRCSSTKSSIFNFETIDTPMYRVASQFSRYCYYACGLAPALTACNVPSSLVSEYLTRIFLKRLWQRKITREMPDSIKCDESSPRQLDRFYQFVDDFVSFTSLINLNPGLEEMTDVELEFSLIHKYYNLVILDVFAQFKSIRGSESTVRFNNNDEIYLQDLSCLYTSVVSSTETLGEKDKKILYELYLMNTLSFLRKAVILIVQVFDTSKGHLNGLDFITQKRDGLDLSAELKCLLDFFSIPYYPSAILTNYGVKVQRWVHRFSVLNID